MVWMHGTRAGRGRDQKIYASDMPLVRPPDRARKPVADKEPREAEGVLAALPWRRGAKCKLSDRFAMTCVRVGDGAVWGNNLNRPGAGAGSWGGGRSSSERRYGLPNLPPGTIGAPRAGGKPIRDRSRPLASRHDNFTERSS